MDFKVIGSIMITSTLLLSACGNEEVKDVKQEKKTEEKEDKAKESKEKIKKQKEKSTTENPTTEETTTEEKIEQSNEPATTEQKQAININNITDRSTLESVVYGDYSEMDKVTAYKSAVDNGVIPQGNVMEGPASAAYESSLRVESGQEKSVYTSNPNPNNPATSKYDHLYNSSNATDDIDPNWSPETENTEDVDAWRENVPGGLSSGEIQMKNLIENGQYTEPDAQEIYNKILEKERQHGN